MYPKKTLLDLVNDYQYGYSLEREFYKNQKIYDTEIEKIFFKNWLLAGHVSQLPNIGDFFLLEFDTESIIIVRTKEGDIKAHLNVCRHRGSRICLQKEGNAKSFVCPYHAWGYNLNGELTAARFMDEHFDKEKNGLHKVHIDFIGGLIFISLAQNPLSFEAMKEDLKDVFKQFGFDNMKLAKQKTFPIAANWKLATENYQECYHCAPSHQEFAKIHAMAQNPENFKEQKKHYIQNSQTNIRCTPSDFYFDLAPKDNECYQYDRNPLLQNMKSGSLGGKPVAPFLGIINEYDGGASELMIGPVNFFLLYNDYMVGYRFMPLSIDTCKCDVFWFVNGNAQENIDYNVDELTWLWDVTTQADEEIIINNQKGVNSHFYKPGKLSKMEYFEQNFLNWYLRAII